jgi:aspartyl-tRNA(Asn)/glutamyl-tRNA(Gln) amidotransferase subunit C
MAKLSGDQVRHIAKLARLTLSDAEVEKFSGELTKILDYIEMLQEVDTSKTEPTASVTGLTNSFREDVITDEQADPDDLLAVSALPTVDHQIQVPSAHG